MIFFFKNKTIKSTLFFLLFLPLYSYAQNDSLSRIELLTLLSHDSAVISSDLETDLNIMTGIGSSKPISLRKSPSILTIITAAEIEKIGARDIIDILRLVPGLDFGLDVQGSVGLGIRGNWAHEGKYLFMVDGQEMNEILYNTMILGNNQLPSNIKQVEIIRGPGSALYGGLAELAVINIITKKGIDYQGVSVSSTVGFWNEKTARTNLQVNGGFSYKKLDISVATTLGKANRSPFDYTDKDSSTYNLYSSSALNSGQLNLGIQYKSFSIRSIYDKNYSTQRDGLGKNLSRPYKQSFENYYFEMKNDFQLSSKISITPKFTYKNQVPWKIAAIDDADSSSFFNYFKKVQRLKGSLVSQIDFTPQINVILGVEYFTDKATSMLEEDRFYTNSYHLSYQNWAGFAQSLFKTKLANFTIGFRYEKNSIYGDAFVPRMGLTRKIGFINTKLLISQSFKAPSVENINLAYKQNIRPEKSTVIELELGSQIGSSWYVNSNLFYINTAKPIIFIIDSLNDEGYFNGSQSGTAGFEVGAKYKKRNKQLSINYSYYTAKDINKIENYATPNSTRLLGFANHKINLISSFDIKKISITPSATFYSSRVGFQGLDSLNNSLFSTFSPLVLANFFINYSGLWKERIKIGFGCYDIFNQKNIFIQPYDSNHRPMPDSGREWIIRLTIDM